jgi:hypothetical protein
MAKGAVIASRVSVGFTLGESSLREEHCSFRQNVIVGDFKFMNADGVVGLDVLASFKSATFENAIGDKKEEIAAMILRFVSL